MGSTPKGKNLLQLTLMYNKGKTVIVRAASPESIPFYPNSTFFAALVALLFPDKTDAAFANYHTWKAVGFTITFVYSNFLCVSTKLIVAMALLVVAITLYVIVELRVHRSRQAEKPPLEIEKE